MYRISFDVVRGHVLHRLSAVKSKQDVLYDSGAVLCSSQGELKICGPLRGSSMSGTSEFP